MKIDVGLKERIKSTEIKLNGKFKIDGKVLNTIPIKIFMEGEKLYLKDLKSERTEIETKREKIEIIPLNKDSFFSTKLLIGKNFHWEREIISNFRGEILILKFKNNFTLINRIDLEEYVKGVISSEMNPNAPLEYLKLHSIISRNFAYRKILKKKMGRESYFKIWKNGETYEVIGWYGSDEHTDFHLCADDHCQRYHGFPEDKKVYEKISRAVEDTKNLLLFFEDEICDTRFSKCCGGFTEEFKTAWDDVSVKYLLVKQDSLKKKKFKNILELLSDEDFFCNIHVEKYKNFFKNFDILEKNFFRWREEIPLSLVEENLKKLFQIDVGRILNVKIVERGKGFRVKKLYIEGEKCCVNIGKELLIRRVLSKTHLKSSLFEIEKIKGNKLYIYGGGWGHGVGLCQIGSIKMVSLGFSFKDILKHYYPGTILKRVGTDLN